MSYTFNAPDPDLDKEVDFDFFDSTEGRDSPTNLGNSGKWKRGYSKSNSDPRNEQPGDKDSAKNSRTKGSLKPPSKQSGSSDECSSSESYSSDYSSASSLNTKQTNVKRIEAKIPRVETDKQSDSEDENTQRSNLKTKAKEKGSHISRPKTSLHSDRRKSRSYSSNSDHSTYDTDSDSSDITSDTDSDVTDVSPLHSPCTPAKARSRKDGKPPVSPQHKEVTFRRPPSSTSSRGSSKRSLTRANSDDINLKLLMQAVMEMERNYNPNLTMTGSAKQRSMFSIPTKNPTSINRKNFSFSNEDVRSIDQENQRLMQQIMRYAVKNKKKKKAQKPKPQTSPNRMSSSAINRNREQMRIERENFALLQRLNAAKATRDLARDKLIKDYQSQTLFGCSVAAAHPVVKKKKSPYTVSFSPKFTSAREVSELPQVGKKTRPSSAVVHGSRPMSGKIRAVRPISATTAHSTRPLSASKRPTSAKVVGTFTKESSSGQQSRPAWEDKW